MKVRQKEREADRTEDSKGKTEKRGQTGRKEGKQAERKADRQQGRQTGRKEGRQAERKANRTIGIKRQIGRKKERRKVNSITESSFNPSTIDESSHTRQHSIH